MSKLEYLKRYAGKNTSEKKKKRFKKSSKFMIYDDDIAWKDSEASQDTIIEDPEDKPVVTEIQDDTIIKWQPLSSSDSVKQNHNPVLLPNQSKEIPYSQSSVDLSVSEEFPITNPRNILPCQSDAYSSASRKHTSSLMTPNARQFIKQISLPITSDLSPPRKCATVHQTVDQGSPESLLFRNNEDLSPPRKGVTVQQTVSQSSPKSPLFQKTNDLSPPRRSKNSSDNINDSSEVKKSTDLQKNLNFADQKRRKSRSIGSSSIVETVDLSPPSKRMRVNQALKDSKQSADIDMKSNCCEETEKSNYKDSSRNINFKAKKYHQKVNSDTSEVNMNSQTGDSQHVSDEVKLQFIEWGRGVTQTRGAMEKAIDDEYEMSKPLARYADDKDLDKMLKERTREGDPMMLFLKKSKNGKERTANAPSFKSKPSYKGDSPANRFGVRPGYRWDGVDRSNGYEKSWLTHASNTKAVAEESYKWSTEDM